MEDKETIKNLEEKIRIEEKKNEEYEDEWGQVLEAYYDERAPEGEADIKAQSYISLYEPSRLILPTISAAVDVAHSSIINILSQTWPIYILKDYPKELKEQADELEKALNLWYSRLNARLCLSPIITEFLLHGWAVAKLARDPWANIPYLKLIPRKDFVAPEADWSPDLANKVEFVAHRFYLSRWELEIRRDKYKNIDEIVEKMRPGDLAELWEVYCYDEKMKDFVYTVSFEKGVVLQKEEYKYPRGFFVFPYIPRRHSWRGTGMGKQLKSLQEERDALHNLNINAIKLYINKIIAVRRGSGIDIADIKAGSKINVNDLENSIRVFDLVRDLHPIQLTAEENSWRYAQMRSMITDYRIGMESRGIERPTARGVMMLLSEANKISNFVVDNVKDVLREIGYTLLTWSYLDKLKQFLKSKEAKEIEQIKSLQVIKDAINLDVAINSAVLNREIQRNNILATMQIVSQYLAQVMPLLAQYPQVPPPVQEIFGKIIKVSDELLDRAMKYFDVDVERPEFYKFIKGEQENERGAGGEVIGDIIRTLKLIGESISGGTKEGAELGQGYSPARETPIP